MADDCWGLNTISNREPEEWSTKRGYDAFHSRYRVKPGSRDWICKRCGCLVGDTKLHDKRCS